MTEAVPTKPADRPRPPTDGTACKPPDYPKPPKLDDPEKCPAPTKTCKCPVPPGATSNCLDKLIEDQTGQITVADRAKAFKTELEAFLAKAKAAEQEYSRAKYDGLVKTWKDQDREIAGLIRTLVCAVPCWRCIIECYVCRRLDGLYESEKYLYGDGTIFGNPATVNNLYDQRYWEERDLEAKKRSFQRIKDVLAVWEKPAQTIEKALTDNAKLIKDVGQALGSDSAKAVYDVFMRVVPMHLAIAPPGPDPATLIDKDYTGFCECDPVTPDDCCGPNVGRLSLAQRLIGPQPYLIDPNDYFEVLCCLVKHRYTAVKDAVANAEAAFQKTDNEIKRRLAQIENGLKSFEKDTKAAIPGTVKCDGDEIAQPKTPTPAQAS